MRLASLWHEGGIHLDADDRIAGPLEYLLPPGLDFVVYQDEYICVANNFLGASAGHPVIQAALDMAVRDSLGHRSDEFWLSSGPGAITSAIAHRGTTADGALTHGILIMPSYRLRPVVAAHVDLNFKSTEALGQGSDRSQEVMSDLRIPGVPRRDDHRRCRRRAHPAGIRTFSEMNRVSPA